MRRPGGLAAFMAFAALILQLLFPAGFMAAPSTGSSHGIAIVICTGEGRVTTTWDSLIGHDQKKTPAKPMAACPFAGHAVANGPPVPFAVSQVIAFAPVTPTATRYVVYPGRGLAAPPPPAIGPPRLI
jgi:hypothetical protein